MDIHVIGLLKQGKRITGFRLLSLDENNNKEIKDEFEQ